jgi:hypothetical protein
MCLNYVPKGLRNTLSPQGWKRRLAAKEVHRGWNQQMRPSKLPVHGRSTRSAREILQRTLQGVGAEDRTALRLSASGLPITEGATEGTKTA